MAGGGGGGGGGEVLPLDDPPQADRATISDRAIETSFIRAIVRPANQLSRILAPVRRPTQRTATQSRVTTSVFEFISTITFLSRNG